MYDPVSNYYIARAKQEDFLREAADDRLARELMRAFPRRSLSRRVAAMIRSVFRTATHDTAPRTARHSAAAPE